MLDLHNNTVTVETTLKMTQVELGNDHHFHSLPDSPTEASVHREGWEQKLELEADRRCVEVGIHRENAKLL